MKEKAKLLVKSGGFILVSWKRKNVFFSCCKNVRFNIMPGFNESVFIVRCLKKDNIKHSETFHFGRFKIRQMELLVDLSMPYLPTWVG